MNQKEDTPDHHIVTLFPESDDSPADASEKKESSHLVPDATTVNYLNALDIPVLICDDSGTILFCNTSIETIFGLKADTVPGMILRAMVAGKDRDKLERDLARLSSTDQDRFSLSCTVTLQEGSSRSINLDCRRVTGGGRTSDLLLCTLRDLSETRRIEDELRRLQRQIQTTQATLTNKELALTEAKETIEAEKKRIAIECQANINRVAIPMLRRIKARADAGQMENIELLERCLQELTSPFLSHMEKYHTTLSPRELEICNFVRDGMTSKQIAGILCTSEATVRAQRKMIRKKLGIANEKISLKAALKSY